MRARAHKHGTKAAGAASKALPVNRTGLRTAGKPEGNRAENRETSLIKRKESLFKRRSGNKDSEVLFLGGRRVCIISEQISAHRR